MPVFILDMALLDTFPKPDQRLVFVIAALKQLEQHLTEEWLHLQVHIWDPKVLIPQLTKTCGVDAVYANRSYGDGSITRDMHIAVRAQTAWVWFHMHDDYLLVEPDQIPVRKVFTPFFKLRQKTEKQKYVGGRERKKICGWSSPAWVAYNIDRSKVEQRLQDAGHLPSGTTYLDLRPVDGREKRTHTFERDAYHETRNLPAIDGSTKLSPYIRFGLISIRKIYELLAERKTAGAEVIISELARREFWHHIAYHFPQSRRMEFQEKRKNLARSHNEAWFEAWKRWATWYPIVDAGMRQLLQEGWMHNRVRMVVASFLTKDLLIDRRWWERHFAHYLLDYDANVNIGNRQWAASVWADPKPLRIFSPILQAQRFDAQGEYILHYCPELRGQPLKAIHDPLTHSLEYISPIVNHYEMSKRAKLMYDHACFFF